MTILIKGIGRKTGGVLDALEEMATESGGNDCIAVSIGKGEVEIGGVEEVKRGDEIAAKPEVPSLAREGGGGDRAAGGGTEGPVGSGGAAEGFFKAFRLVSKKRKGNSPGIEILEDLV
jgi:hypothetical protein